MRVGIIGDIHLPFEDEEYIDFCEEVFDKFKVEKVIQIGDLLDNHSISFHERNVDGFSANEEFYLSLDKLKDWMGRFKNVDVLKGNHDRLIERQFKNKGIPELWRKDFSEALEFTNGWMIRDSLVIDDVLHEHGDGFIGKNGALTKAIYERRSSVIGHSHGFAGVQYHSNGSSTIFGMNVGCGIDEEKYAFEYGRCFKNKAVISCGVVLDGEQAFVVKMPGR